MDGARVDQTRVPEGGLLHKYGYRVLIGTTEGEVPLAPTYSATVGATSRKVAQINSFLQESGEESLEIRLGGNPLLLLGGAILALEGLELILGELLFS